MDDAYREEVKQLIAESFREQQGELLRATTSNSIQIVEKMLQKTTSHIQDTIDDEIAGSSSGYEFKNNINKSNFKFAKEVNDTFKKTARAIADNDRPKANGLIEKGKTLSKERIEALRVADKEGWDVALAYLNEDLVSGAEKEKKLKTARKEATTAREVAAKKRKLSSHQNYTTERDGKKKEDWYSQNRGERSSYGFGGRKYGNEKKERTDKTCWTCGRMGHFWAACSKNQ